MLNSLCKMPCFYLTSNSRLVQQTIRSLKKSIAKCDHFSDKSKFCWTKFSWSNKIFGNLGSRANCVPKRVNSSNSLKIGLSVAVAVSGKVLFTTAFCEAQSHPQDLLEHDRLQGVEKEGEEDPPFSWTQFFNLVKPHLVYFICAIISALVVALINIQIPSLLGEVVNIVSRSTGGQQPSDASSLTSEAPRSFLEEISKPAVKIFKVYVAQACFTFVYITFLTKMGEGVASDLRQDLFQSLLKQDIAFYDKHKAGELVNRLTSDVQDFKSSFKMCVSQGMRSVTQIIGCGIAMYEISPQMSFVTAVVVPVVIGVGAALGGLLRSVSKAAQQQVGLSTAVADECLCNMRTVRAFAMEDEEARLFSREVERSRHLNELLGMGIGVFQAGANMFLNSVVLGTLYVGGRMISSGHIQPGDLMAFLVSAQTIQKSLGQLTILWGTFVRGVSAGARVFEYMNTTSTIPVKGGQTIPDEKLVGNVEFRDVSFIYPTRKDHAVLTDFSLKIPAYKVVAIVGASGAGKSTLAQLLERFYDVNSGSIEIDGVDIRTLDPSWLRGSVIGFINQEPILFATSIRENIRYGRPDATDAEVEEAAVIANADEFIRGFPRGYNTVVGERGVAVSGGQKQRIAIARALLKNPSILVLDEATSALDAESESAVQKALQKCLKGRTTVVIAHRLSTVKDADVIAVMSKGKLAELGTHESLKKQRGIYAELIRQQQQEEAVKGRWNFFS